MRSLCGVLAVLASALGVAAAGAVTGTDTITTFAGNGTAGYSGDGGPATAAQLNYAVGTAADPAGNVYIADQQNQRVRRVDPGGTITTIAGTGAPGYSGDGGPAAAAQLHNPFGLAADGTGNLYVADVLNQVVRKIDAGGTISTVAGNGTPGYSGDGGPATAAQLHFPVAVAPDGAGGFYVADQSNNRIRHVSAGGIITTVAGTGIAGYSGDGGPATLAQLNGPWGLARDGAGNLYVADVQNHAVRRIGPGGTITTVAGTGTPGFSGDGGPAALARLNLPSWVALDAGGLYIADSRNERIRRVDTGGTITTIAGTGTAGYSGDGGPAAAAQLNYPIAVSTGSAGRLYVSDLNNQRIRVIGAAPPPVGPPTSKDECKHDGWRRFDNPPFENQGDCVSYVATHGKNRAKG